MTAPRTQASAHDNTGTTFLAQSPTRVSLASPVLASVISLPKYPLIAYSVFRGSPTSNVDHLNAIELARRQVFRQSVGRDILTSLLPTVHISKDSSALYIFTFASSDRTSESQSTLTALQFDGLECAETSTFQPSSVYPCSASCSMQTIPCPQCLHPVRPYSSSLAHLLPRQSLQLPFHYFLNAVRDRLLNDIAEASSEAQNHRPVTRYKDGFVLGPSLPSSEWSMGWEDRAHNRPLIYSSLDIQLSHSCTDAQLIIRPILRPTFYLQLKQTLPIPTKTPIILLPHGVPAYYLNTYGGPSTALTSQFQAALEGLGAGDWRSDLDPPFVEDGRSTGKGKGRPVYVIAWLSVQNKQGEDKGMPIVWPARLCLSYHPSSPSPHARTVLPHSPELPSQLQASPPPPAPFVPLVFTCDRAVESDSEDLGGLQPAAVLSPGQDHSPPTLLHQPHLQRSPSTVESLRAFRGMSLTSKSCNEAMRTVITEVCGYVDSVAIERERERERLKRERETANTRGRTSSISASAHASESTVVPHQMPATIAAAETVHSDIITVDQIPSLAMVDSPMDQDIGPVLPPSQESSTDSLFSPPAGEVSPLLLDDVMEVVEEHEADISTVEGNGQPSQAEEGPGMQGNAPSTFDAFTTFNDNMNAWTAAASTDYMGVDMDLGIGFDINIGSFENPRSAAAGIGDFDMDDGFGVFTDDDFSFFDAPSAQTRVPEPPLLRMSVENDIRANGLLTSAPPAFSPRAASVGTGSLGPGPPLTVLSNRPPWLQSPLAEVFTPQTYSGLADGFLPAPELIPPSPTKTPSSHSVPTTPNVQIADPHGGLFFALHSQTEIGIGSSVFDPIPFAEDHRIADGKYASGKFALPSPPDSEHRFEAVALLSSPDPDSWRIRYNAVTDPRVGVMRKLIEVKRKTFDEDIRGNSISPSWTREYEEWQSSAAIHLEEETSSDSDSEETWVDEDTPASVSRPSTPPPSYLPMGPTLLQTHFQHARLLPMSAPLRHPGTSINNALGGPPITAPTPVSPAAVLGATSEKSKSLEAAVQILVKEVVENNVWADSWRVNTISSSTSFKPSCDVWHVDIKRVARLLQSTRPTEDVINLQELCGPAATEPRYGAQLCLLEPPMLSIAKSDALIQVLPTALRFWEKVGLGPRAGRKDVTAFVFYEDAGGDKESRISQWLEILSVVYSAKNYGEHAPGMSPTCIKPGLVPVRFDSFKKTLVKFVSELPAVSQGNFVFYIVVPPSVVALESPVLRQLFSAIKRTMKAQHTRMDIEILYHFVPEAVTAGVLANPHHSHDGLETFVAGVYDRLLRPVVRSSSQNARVRASFQAPAFALACPIPVKRTVTELPDGLNVKYTLGSHSSALDVIERHMIVHVGYLVTPCRRWLLTASVDELGDAHDMGAWLLPDDSVETFIADQVWSFARTFASRASLEWRMVITKLGVMNVTELNAWMHHLDGALTTNVEAPPIHVALLSVEHQRSLTFFGPTNSGISNTVHPPTSFSSSRSPSRTSSSNIFADTSSATYALFPPRNTQFSPALAPDSRFAIYPGSTDLPHIPDYEDEGPPPQEQSAMRGLGRSMLIHVPAGNDFTPITTVDIVHLHTVHFQASSAEAQHAMNDGMTSDSGADAGADDASSEDTQILHDITCNFHALTVLGQARRQLRERSFLPLHLAALEVMKMVLTGEPMDG